ncbi:DUF885 domain-containing protein [Microbulbifer hydrolyticus]|uniref:DUF885 family protein n=1 Tax=Microbulbifer hydrolyticus TaxID=48074 RepID=A0A6P1TFX3_9GAMM|nr:DUF885 domain-containing protein [Microbulbifer hydrolyticus]MBB5211879.1 uncharacterized protein (DUF885 family) [Microbulbifer hydrolyticus]QHQ40535.1 DUF885 family protein [Microbulbifer hydrolyticus]
MPGNILTPFLRATTFLISLLAVVGFLVSPAVRAESASEQLRDVIEDHWQYSLREDPITAGRMGEKGFNDRLPGVAEKDRSRRLKEEKTFVARLEKIDSSQLTASERVNRDLLTWVLKNSMESNEQYLDRIPVNTFYSFWSAALDASSGLNMRKVSDYEDYIKRIQDFGRYFDENIANMRAGIKDRFVLPKIVVEGIAPTVRAQVYDDPEKSSLYEPFRSLPEKFSDADKKRLQKQGAAAIKQFAIPAFDRVATFLEGDYMAAATESIAVEDLPGGKDYYRHAIKTYVTLDMDPAEIHQIGLAEVKRIRGEMNALIAQLKKEGKFSGSFEEFTEFLRTDPQFYAETPRELLKEASYIAKRIDYRLPEFFGKLPRLPYGVVPVPDEIAPNYTTASYNPAAIGGTRGGAYWVNTHALDQRPLYELVALTLHEAVPGHHLQGALSQELENVPNFRRNLYLSAYGEGWALYTERLGVEMGVYENAYQQFGRLSYEMWRAARLVIDTGIHSQGWTRQQALDFLADNTSLSRANVRAEVDRYISWPGQALSYKMGEIKIRELRAKAEKALGDQFDLRAFHDAVLANGALPMEMLEVQMDRFIAENKS